MTEIETLYLKWGTVKGWENLSEGTACALQKWADISGMSMGVATQDKTDAHQEALCVAIDAVQGVIWNDWDGREMTKDEAKEYVRRWKK